MTESKSKSTTSQLLITPKGRLSYPHLFSRNSEGEFPSDKYETTFLIPKSVDIDSLTMAATQCMKKAFGDKFASLEELENPPVRDGDEKGGEYAGHWFLKAKSDQRPQVVGKNPKVLIDSEDEVYGGQYARLSIVCFSYTKGNPGVSWALRNVQILGGGDKFGSGSGDPAEQFEEYKEDDSANL